MDDVSRASTRSTASGFRTGPCPRGEGRSISAMSASPADVDRTNPRSERVQTVYEMLARIEGNQRRHDDGFAEIGTDLTELRGQVSELREDVASLDTKVSSLDTKVTTLDDKVTTLHTKVTDLDTKAPIPGAVIDIWQASANGKYDFQDPEHQTPNNLRGKFRCNCRSGRAHRGCRSRKECGRGTSHAPVRSGLCRSFQTGTSSCHRPDARLDHAPRATQLGVVKTSA